MTSARIEAASPAATAAVARHAVELTRALVRCPSVTPHEGGALSLLEGVLGAAGFDVERVAFSAPGTPDVENLYARYGDRRPRLVFAGHTDVVPPGDEAAWRFGPFDAVTEDGVLYGRGVVDMKGGVAASVAAAVDFVARNPDFDGSIAFLITGDEEGPAVNGTVKLLQWAKEQGEAFDHCILGEPTNPDRLGEMIKIGRRGSLTGRLTVRGVQGHVAYPHRAQNPIPALLRYLQALTGAPLDSGNERFDPSSLVVTSVDVGNAATNVIPAEARAVFNIRFNDIWTLETLKEEVRRRLEAVAGDGPRFTLSFDPSNAVAFLTEPGPFVALMADAIAAETGLRPELSTSGGTSDARFIKDYCPVIEFGLVGDTMHQVNERAPVAELEALARIYLRMIEKYFDAAAAGALA
ncbi:succinyl-diaminopimelate desuccinylase [Camelimonas abortus]|uniref:Succinyl-diaminopimelate desuccinylase n=1 Tax=Camelimonas abortus TaxID=1017184 RepID=A0ABV7LB49_9HYPH